VGHIRVAFLGTPSEGERLVTPLRQAAPTVGDTLGEMPFADFASIHNDPVDPLYFCEWTAKSADFPAETVDDCRTRRTAGRSTGGVF
jgi:hypothetical protein